jgi:hypothetical protein
MGKLQQAQDVEAGKASLEELRGYGGDMDTIVDSIKQLAMNYELYRSNLESDDVAYADAALDYAIAQNKPKLDSLSPGEKARVDTVMAGLGFSPTV